jgi:hypothetical protein
MGHSTMAAALMYQHATDQRAREIAARLKSGCREQEGGA